MDIATGVRIGSFEVRAHIGGGGMGDVYSAHDARLGRDVAIKVLNQERARDSAALRRFEREARAASALNHPNIVTVYEIGEYEGAPFIAMELIDGTRLRDLFVPDAPMPLRRLLPIATQLTEGLAAAHERGMIHRDIKPENVMITTHGLVKILDFGLARLGRQAEGEETTAELITHDGDRRIMGTVAYMSPEQAEGRVLDHRSDQFSLGTVLYEMVTGKRPFRGDSIGEIRDAIIHRDPEPIHAVNPKAPASLCQIIERCLSKYADDRYASTADLARDLATLRDHLPETSSGERLERALGMARRRPAKIAVATLAVATAGALVLTMIGRLRPEPGFAERGRSVAILPFDDESDRPEDRVFSQGLADAVSTRLAEFPGIQVIAPTSTAPLVAEGADGRRIARELGASLLLRATVQRLGDTLKVRYALRSPEGARIATDTVTGGTNEIWTIRDQLSAAVAQSLGVEQQPPPSRQNELDTPQEQDLYLRALGHLHKHEDPKELDAALALLRELLETASGSPLVHAALGRTYLRKYYITKERDLSERSIAASERARALDPASAEVLLTLAEVQNATGRYPDAIETFKRVLTLQPDSAEAAIQLATAYQASGQLEDAERAYRRGIALRPAWWSGYNELGVLYLNNNRYDEAAAEFQRVIELNPETHWGYANLGVIHIFKQRLPEAIGTFTRALSIREETAGYANLGYCYYYLGQYDKSADAYRKAIALKPKLATHWANLADACRWTTCAGEAESANAKAIELLRDELAVNPKNARSRGTLAVCLAKTGNRDEAQENIREALTLQPQNAGRMFQAGRVENFLGNTEGAVSWLRRAADEGFGEMEIRRDPEFRALRESAAFRAAFPAKEAI